MILIISTRHNDTTTDQVIDWLNYYRADYIRVNGFDLLDNLLFSEHDGTFKFIESGRSSHEISVIWYRRWHDKNHFAGSYETSSYLNNDQKVLDYVYDEFLGLREYFFECLRNHSWLHKPEYLRVISTKKPHQLRLAKSVGLNVPKTLVSNTRSELEKFAKAHGPLIIKNLSMVGAFNDPFEPEGVPVGTYTKKLTLDEIRNLPDQFSPILVQQLIPKEFEVRIFHFHQKNFQMAIFSQLESRTELDFRNYSVDMKQRWIPYSIPEKLDNQINEFMNKIDLESGSLDFIFSEDGEYYFLEVNPEGQFGMVSSPCNYYIEKQIAQKLIEYEIG